MKVNVTTYKYEKVPVKDTELFIPDKPFYCFQTGVRRAIRIIPKFTDWESPHQKKGEIWELEVTCVYQSFECIAEKFEIRISELEELVSDKNKSKESEIVKMLLNEDYYKRSKEQFEGDLQCVIDNLNTVNQ